MIQPRSYQSECVSAIWAYFTKSKGNPIAALPTGTGKSVIIALFIYSIFQQFFNQRVLVLTHVKELIEQNHEKLISIWPQAPAGIYSAGLNRRDINSKILFAGIASIAKRWAELGKVDLILIDECQLVSPNDETTYRTFIENLRTINPHIKVIGFTATPYRLGHGSIIENGGIFTDICFDITGLHAFNRLIAEGFLAPLIPKRTDLTISLDGVHIRAGDYIQSELQKAVDKEQITEAALKETMEQGADRRAWLIFAAGVEHACNIADMLNGMGVPTGVVHGKMSSGERKQVIADFKSGKLRAVVNNNILTTGFDYPAIDLIVVLRPTCSAVLWVQMLGRGTRPCEGKENCLVLDFAGNTKKLGPINDPVIPHKKGKATRPAPVKECPKCKTYNHASARICIAPLCGHEFTFETKLNTMASTNQIVKGDLPQVEVFKVDHITYMRHEKAGANPSLKVTYYVGLTQYIEWVLLEHSDNQFLQRKARKWWSERSSVPMPDKVDLALGLTGELQVPTHIRVWVNKKYPEIMAYCYDGTAFGKDPAPETVIKPTSESMQMHPTSPSQGYAHLTKKVKIDVPVNDWKALKAATVNKQEDEDLEGVLVECGEDDLPF